MVADYQLDIIRHGFSCGNLYHMYHVTGEGPQDPYLSDFGILQVIDLRKRLLERGGEPPYDHILTSYLRRAIETALLLFAPRDLLLGRYPELTGINFGDWPAPLPPITVIPYASEISADFDENRGIGMERLRQEFHAFDYFLDFQILSHFDPDCSTEYDHDNLLNVLYSLPRHSRIALISHGNVMRSLSKFISKNNYSISIPRNTELWPLSISNGQMQIVGEPLRPAVSTPPDKYDRRCNTQTAGRRHGTSKNSKRTNRSNKRPNRTHKRRTIRR